MKGKGKASGMVEHNFDVEDLLVEAGQEAIDDALDGDRPDEDTDFDVSVETEVRMTEVIDVDRVHPEGHCPECGEPLKVDIEECFNCGWTED